MAKKQLFVFSSSRWKPFCSDDATGERLFRGRLGFEDVQVPPFSLVSGNATVLLLSKGLFNNGGELEMLKIALLSKQRASLV